MPKSGNDFLLFDLQKPCGCACRLYKGTQRAQRGVRTQTKMRTPNDKGKGLIQRACPYGRAGEMALMGKGDSEKPKAILVQLGSERAIDQKRISLSMASGAMQARPHSINRKLGRRFSSFPRSQESCALINYDSTYAGMTKRNESAFSKAAISCVSFVEFPLPIRARCFSPSYWC